MIQGCKKIDFYKQQNAILFHQETNWLTSLHIYGSKLTFHEWKSLKQIRQGLLLGRIQRDARFFHIPRTAQLRSLIE